MYTVTITEPEHSDDVPGLRLHLAASEIQRVTGCQILGKREVGNLLHVDITLPMTGDAFFHLAPQGFTAIVVGQLRELGVEDVTIEKSVEPVTA